MDEIQKALKERAARLRAQRRENELSETDEQSSISSKINTNESSLVEENPNHQLIEEVKKEINELRERITRIEHERHIALNELQHKEQTLRQLTESSSSSSEENLLQSTASPSPRSQREMTQQERESMDREYATYLQRQMDIEQTQQQPPQQNNMTNSNFTFSFSSNGPNGQTFSYSSSNDHVPPPDINSLFSSAIENEFLASHFSNMIGRPQRNPFSVGFPLHFGSSFPIQNLDEMDHDALIRLQEMIGNVPRGANEQQIESLPTSTFQTIHESTNENKIDEEKKQNTKDEGNEKCAICLEKFKNGEQIRTLPCFHIFHKDEIDQWLVRNRVCPICRRAIDEDLSQNI